MKTILTAEELIDKYSNQHPFNNSKQLKDYFIEFAKLHVEAALKAARDDFYDYKNKDWIGEDILNSYSISNIK